MFDSIRFSVVLQDAKIAQITLPASSLVVVFMVLIFGFELMLNITN